MPTTITALIIVIVAIFPGVLGNGVYQAIVGIDWRDKEFQIILRLTGFSVAGAVLYSVAADLVKVLPLPLHLIPHSYESLSDKPETIVNIIYPYIGHLFGGFISGVLAALAVLLLAKISSTSAFPGAWDDFIRKHVSKHWVIVGLKNGDVYAGKIKTADLSVSKDERDIILEEPCLYEESTRNYRSLNYQYIFLAAENLYSLARRTHENNSCTERSECVCHAMILPVLTYPAIRLIFVLIGCTIIRNPNPIQIGGTNHGNNK